ncbi:MAG: host-nuclease inhibitor Gam family protein [Candidatus Sumerlaeales bacterium]|nr:host-nuclease inhibitor Gam family protein [Candidatus Sumerlaeales bacterium]
MSEYTNDEFFQIDNDSKADWAIEKIMAENAERDRLIKLADERIKELSDKKKELTDKAADKTSYLTALLRMYFDTIEPKATKTQSTYKLLSGKLVLKHQQPEYVLDDAQMVSWAKTAAPAYIKVKESINWAELKKLTVVNGETVLLADTGEVIPGAMAKERPDVFEVAQ